MRRSSAKPVFGGEAFPVGPLSGGRHTPIWTAFDYTPWVISLSDAEEPTLNGVACPPGTTPDNPHTWVLSPDPGVLPRREGAIFPMKYPECNGSPKRHSARS